MSDNRDYQDSPKVLQTNSFLNIGHIQTYDIAEHEHLSEPWEIMSKPLDKNTFASQQYYLITPSITISIENFVSAIQIQGLTPPGMLAFSIPLRIGSKTLYWNASPFFPGMPASLPGGLDVVVDASQVHLLVLIELSMLDRMLPEELAIALKKTALQRWLPAADQAVHHFGRWLVALLARAHREPEVFQHPAVLKTVEEDVLQQMLDTIELPRENSSYGFLSKRRLGFDRALEFIREADVSSLTVPDICSSAGVSQRTLEYAFQENFNMTPVKYLRLMRFHSMRRALLKTQAGSVTVTDIAFYHGIYDMGRFASAYRQRFDELPSQTLDKPAINAFNPFL